MEKLVTGSEKPQKVALALVCFPEPKKRDSINNFTRESSLFRRPNLACVCVCIWALTCVTTGKQTYMPPDTLFEIFCLSSNCLWYL